MEATVQRPCYRNGAGACCGCCGPEPAKLTEATEPAIRLVVDRFYAKVRADAELGPIFDRAIADWRTASATMRRFLVVDHADLGALSRQSDGRAPPPCGADAGIVRALAGAVRRTCDELFDPAPDRRLHGEGEAHRHEPSARPVLQPKRPPKGRPVTFVVTENCIKCEYMDCVEVFSSTASTKARTCSSSIRTNASTAACASPECPAEAIFADTEPGLDEMADAQCGLCRRARPNIAVKRAARAAIAAAFDGRPDKFDKYFSSVRGKATGGSRPTVRHGPAKCSPEALVSGLAVFLDARRDQRLVERRTAPGLWLARPTILLRSWYRPRGADRRRAHRRRASAVSSVSSDCNARSRSPREAR